MCFYIPSSETINWYKLSNNDNLAIQQNCRVGFKVGVEGENQAYAKLSLRNHLNYQKSIKYRLDKQKSARFSSSVEQIAVSFGGVLDKVVACVQDPRCTKKENLTLITTMKLSQAQFHTRRGMPTIRTEITQDQRILDHAAPFQA